MVAISRGPENPQKSSRVNSRLHGHEIIHKISNPLIYMVLVFIGINL